jgi:hypothetical protein
MKMVTEEDINSVNTAIGKKQGEAYFQINTCYRQGGGASSLDLVNDDGRFVWCTVTHLG